MSGPGGSRSAAKPSFRRGRLETCSAVVGRPGSACKAGFPLLSLKTRTESLREAAPRSQHRGGDGGGGGGNAPPTAPSSAPFPPTTRQPGGRGKQGRAPPAIRNRAPPAQPRGPRRFQQEGPGERLPVLLESPTEVPAPARRCACTGSGETGGAGSSKELPGVKEAQAAGLGAGAAALGGRWFCPLRAVSRQRRGAALRGTGADAGGLRGISVGFCETVLPYASTEARMT